MVLVDRPARRPLIGQIRALSIQLERPRFHEA
jgi:hypothetical protein